MDTAKIEKISLQIQLKIERFVKSKKLISRREANKFFIQIRSLYFGLEKTLVTHLEIFLREEFAKSARAAVKAIPQAKKTISNSNKVENIIYQVKSEVRSAINGGQETARRFIRQTQQTAVDDIALSKDVVGGTEAIDSTSSRIQKRIEKAIGKGKLLTINGRNYNVEKYARLVARTRGRELNSLGVIESCQKNGWNFVRVSSHGTDTDICKKYEGKIFSFDGVDYPKLKAYAPFHVHCRHNIYVWVPG